ncbi:hypothetical protein GCM10008967_30860 [Bacillus carboniphilus]|uniref:SWIM-type domain-containing protein n=1 Tax=Bacillus carboniphilus TaxID=86663 RepID=A0ABP3G8S7_9BACI
MKIMTFEEHIDDLKLKRGKDYYLNDHIKSIEEISKNSYIVEVVGTDTYLVQIFTNDKKEILSTTCDCNYDRGEFCKHQIAAFFALKDRRKKSLGKTGSVTEIKRDRSRSKKEH